MATFKDSVKLSLRPKFIDFGNASGAVDGNLKKKKTFLIERYIGIFSRIGH